MCRCFALMLVGLASLPGIAGERIVAALQTATVRAMAGRRGAAVVLDVRSGDLLAAYHLEVAARRVVHPGSSIKPFTLLALLQRGKARRAHRADVQAQRFPSAATNSTAPILQPRSPWSRRAPWRIPATHTSPPLQRALHQHSCATAWCGPDSALLPGCRRRKSPATSPSRHSPEELQLQAIGEWGISVTPLELLHGYRDLATLAQTDPNGKLSADFRRLATVGHLRHGTHGAAEMRSMKVAGKTGTAMADEGPWTHAWFAGYAPAENP